MMVMHISSLNALESTAQLTSKYDLVSFLLRTFESLYVRFKGREDSKPI